MSRLRLVFTGIILFFLVGAGVAWILSNQRLIPSTWAPSLATTFSVLGVLVAFFQWILPLPSSETKTPVASSKSSHVQELFLQQWYNRLTQGTGAVIVYQDRERIGRNIDLDPKDSTDSSITKAEANVVERTVDGHPFVAAVFPSVKPGNYRIWGAGVFENITVFPGQVSEVDGRKKEVKNEPKKKGSKQKRLQVDLRLNTFIIALGGVGFIVQKYLITPYPLDIVGNILIGLGIINLLASFILDWFSLRLGVYLRVSVFLIELGGGVFLAHRYTTLPYLANAWIILIELGGVNLLSILLLGWFQWFQEGGGVAVFIIELVVVLIIAFREVISPYLPIAGFILLGLIGVVLIGNIIAFIYSKITGKDMYDW